MKKKVKFNVSIASETFSYKPGEEAVIDAKLAEAWIASGVAKPAEVDPDELKAQIAELQAQLAGLDPKKK